MGTSRLVLILAFWAAQTSVLAAPPAGVRQIIAHRGSSADRPENTLAAARRALEAGATAIECDVRRTKDGRLVLLHDATLDRTTDGTGPVSARTLAEVQKLDAGRWFHAKYAGERVPTLAELLALCRGRIDVLLDLKEQGAEYAKLVASEVRAHGDPKRILAGVRSVEQAKQFRRLLPEARQLGLLATPEDLDGFVSVGVEMVRLWPKWLADESLVRRVRWAGATLHLNGTTGSPEEIRPLLRYRPDSLSSDDPARLLATLAAAPALAAEKNTKTIPIILDTDLGTDIDDAFALALVLASPELELRGVTTVGKQAEDRAWMVCRFLAQTGRRTIPVAAGGEPSASEGIDWQIQYRRHPAVIFNRTTRPAKASAVALLHSLLTGSQEQVTLVALGPLTNLADLLEKHPGCRASIRRIVIMGGALGIGYNGKPPVEAEWNIATDLRAARSVLTSGVPITLIPLDASAMVQLERPMREQVFAAHTPITFQVQSLYELWGKETPVLFDPVAVAAAITDAFFRFEEMWLEIDAKGITRAAVPKPQQRGQLPPVRVATQVDRERFLSWFVQRLAASDKPVLPRPPGNVSALVERGGFPAKVHVAEDYDTDIEKRWWMAGKAETVDVSPGGRRACRAVLTQDFDDLQGDVRAMYRAVIFNPVPGPPMGPRTRLTFRFKLTGTHRLRVQLYSLTHGYHRYLSLAGMPTDRWETATVDLTEMRRPDGTGGPLAANERIDDIQFYLDPRGELLIDDIVLYEAAAEGETRPFPRRVVFTGWFDTGKQGQEWPGDFEIVSHVAPLLGRYARSLKEPKTGLPWLRIALRGERRLDPATQLDFRYRLTGADSLRVELRHSKSGWRITHELRDLPRGAWAAAAVPFVLQDSGKDRVCDEMRFHIPAGGELSVDDMLLYTPGK